MSSEDFLASYNKINGLHTEIFDIIDNAVKLEEAEKPLDAIQQYKEGMAKIDETLSLQVSVPDDKDSVKDQWDEACRIIHKLKRTRAELLQRVGILNEKHQPVDIAKSISEDSSDGEPPSTKVKFTSGKFSTDEETGRPRTYSELARELKNLKKNDGGNEANKLELIFSCDRVKFYKIKPNGTVTTWNDSCTLRILRLEKDDSRNLNTTFFIQIIKSVSFNLFYYLFFQNVVQIVAAYSSHAVIVTGHVL